MIVKRKLFAETEPILKGKELKKAQKRYKQADEGYAALFGRGHDKLHLPESGGAVLTKEQAKFHRDALAAYRRGVKVGDVKHAKDILTNNNQAAMIDAAKTAKRQAAQRGVKMVRKVVGK